MNKVVLGVIGAVVIGAGLFFFSSQKVAAKEIEKQLAALQTNGFVIENRVKKDDGEYFEISLSDLHKFSTLVPQYKQVLLEEDKAALKDMKLGVELVTSGATVSADIYPVKIPLKEASADEKKKLETFLAKKALLLHVNYNGLTKGFDGYLKDINEGVEAVSLKLTGLTFEGTADEVLTLVYNMKNLRVEDRLTKKPLMDVSGIKSDMVYTGLNYYVTNGTASLDSITLNLEDKLGKIALSDMQMHVKSDIKDDLLDTRAQMLVKTADIDMQGQKVALNTMTFDYGLKNIDMQAFNEVVTFMENIEQNVNSDDVEKSIQTLLSKGMIFDIHKIGVDDITFGAESLKGLSLQAHIGFEKDPELFKKLQTMPESALTSMNIDSKISISNEIFSEILKDPRAMMLMMIQPKEENGYKVYDIAMDKGALSINGQPMM